MYTAEWSVTLKTEETTMDLKSAVHRTCEALGKSPEAEEDFLKKLDESCLDLETIQTYFSSRESEESWKTLPTETGIPKGFFEKMALKLGWRTQETPKRAAPDSLEPSAKSAKMTLVATTTVTPQNTQECATPADTVGYRVYLDDYNFVDKERVKDLGGVYDNSKQRWYVPPGIDLAPFAVWREASRIYLPKVNYDDKETAKAHGAKWDKLRKTWYLPGYINDADRAILRSKGFLE